MCGGQTFEETERRHWETMESEWEREKQRILNALVGSGQEGWDFPQDAEVSGGHAVIHQ